MVDQFNQTEIEEKRAAYLKGLYSAALSGNVDAGDELSKIAFGGFLPAQDLVRQMDQKRTALNTSVSSVVKSGK